MSAAVRHVHRRGERAVQVAPPGGTASRPWGGRWCPRCSRSSTALEVRRTATRRRRRAAGDQRRRNDSVPASDPSNEITVLESARLADAARRSPAALSPEVMIARAPQSLRTKATSSGVSMTLIGLTTAPAFSDAVVGDDPLPAVLRVERHPIAVADAAAPQRAGERAGDSASSSAKVSVRVGVTRAILSPCTAAASDRILCNMSLPHLPRAPRRRLRQPPIRSPPPAGGINERSAADRRGSAHDLEQGGGPMMSRKRRWFAASALAVLSSGVALHRARRPPSRRRAPAGPTSEAGGTIDFAATARTRSSSADDQLAALDGQADVIGRHRRRDDGHRVPRQPQQLDQGARRGARLQRRDLRLRRGPEPPAAGRRGVHLRRAPTRSSSPASAARASARPPRRRRRQGIFVVAGRRPRPRRVRAR